jgi:hypothetical protein
MKRFLFAAMALIAVIGLQPQAARAASTDVPCSNSLLNMLAHGQDCRLWWGGLGIGIGTGVASYYLTKKHGIPAHRPMSVGAAWGVTTYGCAVITPFVGTILLNRMLTPREVYTGIGDCIIPFIGGEIVDRILPHDAWTDGTPPKPAKKRVAHK